MRLHQEGTDKRARAGKAAGGAGAILMLLWAGGCTLEPPEAASHRQASREAGRPYEAPFERRSLPELPAQPSWQDVLHRALVASGELEAAYFEWAAAVSEAKAAGAYPNTMGMLGYGYMFSREKMKAWDRTTLMAATDPSGNLSLPIKVAVAARAALASAQAKARRFEAAKFALQQKVLAAWYDFALAAERLRIQEETVGLLKMLSEIAEQRVRAGAPQQDLLRAQTEYEMAVNEQANLAVELASTRAMLNGMMLLPADAPLAAPAELPAPRLLPAGDGELVARAARDNPELAALAKEVSAAEEAAALARLGYLPDLGIQVGLTGSLSRMVSGAIMVPLNWGRVEAEIGAATAMRRRAEAMRRQGLYDLGSRVAATLWALHNDERQAALFERAIVPKARQAWDGAAKAYAAGAVGFVELLDSVRTLLSARRMAAEARMAREKRLAELEALLGADVETLGGTSAASTQAATAPDMQTGSQ